MDSINDGFFAVLSRISEFLQTPIFELQDNDITIMTIIYVLAASFLLIFASKKISSILVSRVLSRYIKDPGVEASIGTIFRYILILVGFITIFQTIGYDLSTLSLLAGALGVGIGFGLQNITNNFISGIIILFERPIKIGDRIEVGDINGDVESISMRSTTVITNDNISVIIPNSAFINNQVINWSHNDSRVRFKIPISVSYKEDPLFVRELVLQVAKETPGILLDPRPDLWFDEYGDSALNFKLIVWTTEYTQRPSALKSILYYAIFKKFAENNIEIPFPQRDLHLKSGFDFMKPRTN
jgi:small-conductance mechanosensitive channel